MKRIVDYRIVIPKNAIFSETRAAYFLQKNIKLVCGKKIPIVDDTTAPEALEIVIGNTSREKLDGLCYNRHFNRMREFVIKKCGDRIYLCGMGAPIEEEPPFRAYGTIKDGGIGTVYAVYKFIEDVLGYDFMSYAYFCYEEKSDLVMPEKYEINYTAESRILEKIKSIDGPSVYSLAATADLQASNSSLIFKTAKGSIVVYDGGCKLESERLLEALRRISGEAVPTVAAWLISHPHEGHVGAYAELCGNERYRGALKVENLYCAFLPKEAYELYRAKEAAENYARVEAVFGSDKSIGATVHTVKQGDIIKVDEVSVEVLRVPTYDPEVVVSVNDTSVVYKVDYNGEQSFILAGDGETAASNDLMKLDDEKLSADILFVPHHGRANLSPKLYERIGAKAYIWQMPAYLWYGDRGDGLNTTGGLVKNRAVIYELGAEKKDILKVTYSDMAFPLPLEIL